MLHYCFERMNHSKGSYMLLFRRSHETHWPMIDKVWEEKEEIFLLFRK